jgi:NADPH-dependent F420 reductase
MESTGSASAKTPAALTIAIIGGTGDLGSGLARLWSRAGYPIVIGSRSVEKAVAMAATMTSSGSTVTGMGIAEAAEAADVIVLSVPHANHDQVVREIAPFAAGKIVIDAAVPLVPPKVFVVQLATGGSPAWVAQSLLGPEVRVVAAFHNVGAKKLHAGERADCDVLVFGDDPAAREQVIQLAGAIASRGVDGGCLANAVAAEALTSVLIAINRRYKVPGAGIRITGLPALSGAPS